MFVNLVHNIVLHVPLNINAKAVIQAILLHHHSHVQRLVITHVPLVLRQILQLASVVSEDIIMIVLRTHALKQLTVQEEFVIFVHLGTPYQVVIV